VRGRTAITATVAPAVTIGGGWVIVAQGRSGDGLTPAERSASARWREPGAVVLKGRGRDTQRTDVALGIMDDRPRLLDRGAAHLREVLGPPAAVLGDDAAWQYRVSVRARPYGATCTRYLTVELRAGRVDGYEIGQERCTDHSVGRGLPTR
jgi:hypothetical protein